jgi:hypothetical protein
MALKGTLVIRVPRKQLRAVGHSLRALWSEFKSHIGGDNAVDGAIAALDRFERLRYPDKMLREGMTGTFTVFRGQQVIVSGPGELPPRYDLVLEDVDSLMKMLFEKGRANPQFYIQRLRPDAITYLSRDNKHPFQ